MGDDYEPTVNVIGLSDFEVQYELAIRNLFVTSDNKQRRRRKLKLTFDLEQSMRNKPQYETPFDFETDIASARMTFSEINELLEEPQIFSKERIKDLEAPVVHLINRLDRMGTPEEGIAEFNTMKSAVAQLFERIKQFYRNLNAEDFNDLTKEDDESEGSVVITEPRQSQANTNQPSSSNNPPNGNFPQPRSSNNPPTGDSAQRTEASNAPNANTNENDLIARLTAVINASVASAVQAQIRAILPEVMRNNRHDFLPNRNSQSSMHLNNSSSNARQPNWFDNDNLFDEEDQIFAPNRRTSPRASNIPFQTAPPLNENRQLNSQAKSIFDWNFHFTGLDSNEDPKGLEIEAFIQKVIDYSKSERLSESDIMSKVQHLLKGPAAEWYSHAQKSTGTWKEFTRKLRDRFSTISNADSLRQQVYSKKQQPGENTMRFIDQFVNLIYQLPEPVTEKQCVEYILKGIRTEVARLARTAKIETKDELLKFVKSNFGLRDKMHDRSAKLAFRLPQGKKVEQLEECSDDVFSDNSCESENEIQEMKKVFEKKRKPDSKSDKKRPIKNHNHSQGEKFRNDSLPRNRDEPIIHCCCNSRNANFISPASSNQSSHAYNDVVCNNAPMNSQVDLLNQPQRSLSCPFCAHNHTYRECPLPSEQKPKHCFVCKTPNQIASTCPCNNRVKSQSVQTVSFVPTQSLNTPGTNTNLAHAFRTQIQSPNVSNANQAQTQMPVVACIDAPMPPFIAYVESLIYFPKRDLRPHTRVIANENSIEGLLDTGSHVTVIGQNLYESRDWKTPLIPHETRIITADSTQHDTLGVLLLSYELNNKKRVVPTLVVPIIMKKPILGIDFQRCFDIGLTFLETNVLEVEASKQPSVYEAHNLSPEQLVQLNVAVQELPVVTLEGELNCTSAIEHEIDTGTAKPIYQRPYIFSPKIQSKVVEEVNRLIDRGIIQKIQESSWLNAVIAVPKPDGSIRLCIDARRLNSITRKVRYSQMNIERILSRLKKAKYFTSIDLKDAFYQIRLKKTDQTKTAFSIHGLGTFAYKRMPMGLVNSAATLCRLVEECFNIETEPEIFVYLDDFIIVSETFERHTDLIRIAANKLKEIGLAIGLNKSNFCMKKLKFVGHVIDDKGVAIDSSRAQAIQNYKEPKSISQVRSFLGLASWFRKFINNYSDIATPLIDLTKKDVKFVWNMEQKQAFESLKVALATAPVLAYPDYKLPFLIETKSSEIGICAILSQVQSNESKPISFMSAKLNDAQKKFHPIERECLAVILALERFRPYIDGSEIHVTTSHNSLLWLKGCRDPTGRIARWALRLQAYDVKLKHKQFPKYAPVCVLSEQIDIDSAPLVEFEILSCDCLAFTLAPEQTHAHIEIIELTREIETRDEWYLQHVSETKAGKQTDHFKWEDGTLYYRHDKLSSAFENKWKICVPSEDYMKVFEEQHENVNASHPGFYRTLRRTQEFYYWPKMHKTIHALVNRCEICRVTKSTNVNTQTAIGSRRETDYPFRVLAADFIGPLTMSKKRNAYLFVVVDTFSKYLFIKAVRNANSATIINVIEELIFLKFGVCERFICDNGVQFISKEFKKFMAHFGVELCFTPFYYPQANPCEIANKSIMNAIRALVAQQTDQRAWDGHIKEITCALNNTVHTSTQISPFNIIFGHNMVLNGRDYIKCVDKNEDEFQIDEKRKAIREFVKEQLTKAFERIKNTHNNRAGTRSIDMTKDTYLRNQKLSNAAERYSKKLAPKYVPVRITKKVGKDTYLVADMNGKHLGKYHSSLLIQK